MEQGTHPKESDIERVALGSLVLDEKGRADIERHCAECAYCKELYESFADLHSTIRKDSAIEPSPFIQDRVALLREQPSAPGETNILRLFPATRESSLFSERPQTVALAAKDVAQKPKYIPLRTLKTVDETSFIRILYDSQGRKYEASVVSDDQASFDRVLVSFEGITEFFPTDRSGIIRIGDAAGLASHSDGACIHRALAAFVIDTEQRARATSEAIRFSNERNDSLTIMLEGNDVAKAVFTSGCDETQAVVLLIAATERLEIVHGERNEFFFAHPKEELTIKLFAIS